MISSKLAKSAAVIFIATLTEFTSNGVSSSLRALSPDYSTLKLILGRAAENLNLRKSQNAMLYYRALQSKAFIFQSINKPGLSTLYNVESPSTDLRACSSALSLKMYDISSIASEISKDHPSYSNVNIFSISADDMLLLNKNKEGDYTARTLIRYYEILTNMSLIGMSLASKIEEFDGFSETRDDMLILSNSIMSTKLSAQYSLENQSNVLESLIAGFRLIDEYFMQEGQALPIGATIDTFIQTIVEPYLDTAYTTIFN